jgi:hypothetical protein
MEQGKSASWTLFVAIIGGITVVLVYALYIHSQVHTPKNSHGITTLDTGELVDAEPAETVTSPEVHCTEWALGACGEHYTKMSEELELELVKEWASCTIFAEDKCRVENELKPVLAMQWLRIAEQRKIKRDTEVADPSGETE